MTDKYQYMIEFNGETHLIDATSDYEAKVKLAIFLNLPGFDTKGMEIFDKMPLTEETPLGGERKSALDK